MLPVSWVSREPIHKGWSGDQKAAVTDAQGNRYLLRISPLRQYDRKRSEFEWMQKAAALGIPMCRPLAFGRTEEGVCSLHSWIDGVDAEEVLSTLPGAAQYAYGLEAGRILTKLHQIPAPANREDWEPFFNRKASRKIRLYQESPVKVENGQAFIDYINAHRSLLKGRPTTFQHGDYHIGNMRIGKDQTLVILDFDRFDFGDPWEEFNRIVWCAQTSPLFASGMVDGYFDGKVPPAFWELLALYISSNTLSAIPWAIPFGEAEIETMRRQAREVLDWYDQMKRVVPTWYRRPDP